VCARVRDAASNRRRLRSGRHHDVAVLPVLPRGHASSDGRLATVLLRDSSLASPKADAHQRQPAVPQGVHVADAQVHVGHQGLPQRDEKAMPAQA